jgi:hypothetical protein
VGGGGAQRSEERTIEGVWICKVEHIWWWCGVARRVLRTLSGGMGFVVGRWDLEGERGWIAGVNGRVVVQSGWSCVPLVWDRVEGVLEQDMSL